LQVGPGLTGSSASEIKGCVDNRMAETGFVFKLFVAGEEQHSIQAAANLKMICEMYLKDRYTIEIIDVFKSFERALEEDIFLSPALVKVSPGPRTVVFGNLTDTAKVVKVLQLVRS
jgi:circadian clock protein KaiB